MPVFTIARQLGSNGEMIASLLARRLGLRLLDDDLLVLASARASIPLPILVEMDERGRSMLRRPGDLVRLVPLPPIDPEHPDVTGDRYPPTGPVQARGPGLVAPAYWALEAYGTLLARTMREEAMAGDVVIVGRAGNEALRGMPGVVHALVVAGQGQRIERIMASGGLSGYHALDRVRESDRHRHLYSRQIYRAGWLDPLRYHVCLNTDAVDLETAVEVIARATGKEG